MAYTKRQLGMFQQHDGDVGKNEWITPPEIPKALGHFDLDPCAPINPPWAHADKQYNINDDGLALPWFGRVWLNPPYDSKAIDYWMQRMADHNNGIALLFNRSDRNTFHDLIYPHADSMLLLKQRITFYHVDGTRAKANGGAPNVFFAYNELNSDAISDSGLVGRHIYLNRVSLLVVGFDQSWRVVVKTVLVKLNEAGVEEVYAAVEKMVPEKVSANVNYRAKIRQMLQRHGKRIRRGVYTI